MTMIHHMIIIFGVVYCPNYINSKILGTRHFPIFTRSNFEHKVTCSTSLPASYWFLACLSQRLRWHLPPKRRLIFNGLQGVISQKIEICSTFSLQSNDKMYAVLWIGYFTLKKEEAEMAEYLIIYVIGILEKTKYNRHQYDTKCTSIIINGHVIWNNAWNRIRNLVYQCKLKNKTGQLKVSVVN
jgi:hypothetical protein